MLDKIRRFVQSFVLKAKLKRHQREKKVSSLNSAKTVGIVCLVDKEINWNIIKTLIKEFQDNKAKIEVMGVFYGNLKPLWFIETLNVTLCTDKELGLSQIPNGMHVDEFLAKEFDLLIDFSIKDDFAPFYLSALSKAKFKIGLDTENNRKHFDLLLKLKETNMNEYKNQLIHYLSKINI
ncbi:MAG: hypothetical protein WC135_03600 [Bacteroidales bacterium]